MVRVSGNGVLIPYTLRLHKVTQAIQATRQNLESITMAMRGKMIEIQARQQGARAMRNQAGA